MSPQNDLLSYTFKETIFLTAEKAGIKSLTELELEPNVEIIENEADVSITGYLLLTAKYDPINEAEEERDSGEGAKSLVEAMKFTPFRLEQGESTDYLYTREQEITHRIPVNISIPRSDIGEKTDIGAIVNSIDYELLGTNQMMVQAELQITGLSLQEQAWDAVGTDESASYPPPFGYVNQYEDQVEASGENWEFMHTAEEEQDDAQPFRPYDPYHQSYPPYSQYEPTSLDEIERKLDALEQEIAFQNQNEQQSSFQPFGNHDDQSAVTPPFPPYVPYQTNYTYPQSPQSPDQSPYASQFYQPPSPDVLAQNWQQHEESAEQSPTQSPYASQFYQPPSSDVLAQNWQQHQESAEQSVEQFGEQSAEHSVPLQFGDISITMQEETERHIEFGESKTFDSPHLQSVAEGMPLESTQPFTINLDSGSASTKKSAAFQSAAIQHESAIMEVELTESAIKEVELRESAQNGQPNDVSYQSDLKLQAEAFPLHDSALHTDVRNDVHVEEDLELSIHPEGNAVDPEEAQQVAAELESASLGVESVLAEAQEPTADNKEVKIAISTKAAPEKGEAVNLTNLFTARRDVGGKGSDSESASSSARGAQAAQESKRSSLELFSSLSSYAQGQTENFSKMRMCIIQKNETLEGIAARYSVSMGKLMEVNRLPSDRVAAGQILYIP
ncbi:UNVERIFIED_CONTAM: stage VI sporulation protein D [Brevibacillus sp. OAP136]